MNKSVIAALSAAVILVCAIAGTMLFSKPIDEMRRDMWKTELRREINSLEALSNIDSWQRVDAMCWLRNYDKSKERVVLLYWKLYGIDVSNYSLDQISKLPIE